MALTGCEFHTNVKCLDEVRSSLQHIQQCLKNIAGGAIAGVASYLTLSDVMPFDSTYVGRSGFFPQVNAGATGLQLFDLFGTTNHFTVGQIIDQFVDLGLSGSVGIELAAGQLNIRSGSLMTFELSGQQFMTLTSAAGFGARWAIDNVSGADTVIDMLTGQTIKFQPASSTVLELVAGGATVTGTLTVGSLTGYIKGTTGILSAVSGIPSTDITGIIGLSHGGTGADLSATGGASQVVRQSSAGAAFTVSQLAASDLSNGTTGSGAVVLASSPTIVTPTIASFLNAQHDHRTAAGGGLIDASSIGSGILTVPFGGTGLGSLTQGDIPYASATNTLSALAKNVSSTRYLSNTGTSNNPAWAAINLSNGVSNTLSPLNGGTGFGGGYTKGDLLVGFSSNVLARLGVSTDGFVLTLDAAATNGVKWAALPAVTHTILSATHTDTLVDAIALGDLFHVNSTPKWARLAGNTTTAQKFLTQTGNGSISAVPAWFDLFSANNHFTGSNTFDNEVLLNDSATRITRPSSGVFALVGNTRVDVINGVTTVLAVGLRTMTFDGPSTNDMVFDWTVDNSFKMKIPTGTTIATLSSAGVVINNGILTVGSLAGVILGTAGVLSAITTGSNGDVLTVVAGVPAFAAPSGVGTHNLLSASHPDTTPGTVARGDLITGQTASPTWKKLAIGAAATFLRSDGTDAAWFNLFGSANTWSALQLFSSAVEMDSYQDIQVIADPGSPATNKGRLFTRLNGANLELVFRGPLGGECVLCSQPNSAVAMELQLDWVE